jgi:hypothetical protein
LKTYFYVIVIGQAPNQAYWSGPGRGYVADFDYALQMTRGEAEMYQIEYNLGGTRIEEHGYL